MEHNPTAKPAAERESAQHHHAANELTRRHACGDHQRRDKPAQHPTERDPQHLPARHGAFGAA